MVNSAASLKTLFWHKLVHYGPRENCCSIFFYLQDSSSTLSLKAYGVKGLLGLEVSREAAKSNKGTRYIRHLYYYLFCAWPTFIYLQLGDVQCQLAQLIFICHGDP